MGLRIQQRVTKKARVITTLITVLALIAQPTYGILAGHVANAASAITVTSSNLNGWSSSAPYADTRAGSTVSFASDSTVNTTGNGALKIVTNSDTGTKAQFMKSANNLPLSSVTGPLGYSTKQNSAPFAGANASYQIQVYLNQNGAGTGYATLGYEPYVNHSDAAITKGIWQDWDVTGGLFYSSKTIDGVGGGVVTSQGDHTYTLAQIKSYFPDATVIAYGLNVGSNNPNYNVEADNFTFNGVTYNFEAIIPTISITPGANSVLRNTGNTTFTVTSDTATPAWMYVELNRQGNWIAANNGGGNSTSLTYNTGNLTEGVYTIKVDAFESNGNSQEKLFNFVVDHTAPANVTISPINADGSSVVRGVVPFSVSAVDPNYSYSYLEVNRNGAWITDNTHGSSNYDGSTLNWGWDSSTVPDGIYTLKADAVDKAGNTTERNVNFTVDNSAPTGLVNLSPAKDAHVTTANLTQVTWHAAVDAHGPVAYFYEVSNSKKTNLDGSFVTPAYGPVTTGTDTFIDTLNTPAGTYFWHVRAIDTLGNSTGWTTPWRLTVDNTSPVATFNFPAVGPSAKSFQVVFDKKVKKSDAENPANYQLNNWPGAQSFSSLAGHATVKYAASTSTATITFTDSAWYVSPEQQWGVQNIHDLAGNLVSPNPTVGYSSPLTAPTTPGTPTATSALNDRTIVWTWAPSTDVGSGMNGYYYQLTQDGVAQTNWIFTTDTGATTPVAADGTYELHVYAVDMAGSPDSITADGSVVINTVAPVITVNAHSDTNVKPTLMGTVNVPVKNVMVSIDGDDPAEAVVDPITKTWTYTPATAFAVGSHTIVAVATDMFGNIGTTSTVGPDGNPVLATFTVKPVVVDPLPAVTATPATISNFGPVANPASVFSAGAASLVAGPLAAGDAAVLGAQDSKQGDSGVLGASKDTAAIAPSAQGWKIFGLAWYWWILLIAAVAAIWWWIVAARRSNQNA